MKRIVLIFGVIAAVISSVSMLLTLPFIDRIGFDHSEVLGYTLIVASFLPVFFGIRAYRDQVNGGVLTFGRGVSVGLLITLIGCAGYVATWEFIYFKVAPDFVEKYSAHVLHKARASGASQAALDEQAKQMQAFQALYANPLINAAITLIEPLPVGIFVTLVSAAVLRRREAAGRGGEPAPAIMPR